MRRHRIVLLVAAVAALAITGVPTASATAGAMVLGAGRASDINNAGVVVGTGGPGGAARWDAIGRLSGLARPSDGAWTHASMITNSGFILGGAQNTQEPYIPNRAVLWTPRGQLIELPFPPGATATYARDINEDGAVVGVAVHADGYTRAVRWDARGRLTELPVLAGGSFSNAVDVNDHGIVVGYSDVVVAGTHYTHAVYWDAAGRIGDLGPRAGENSQAVGINNAGTIVGTRGTSAVKWSHLGRVATRLELPPNFTSGSPVAVNEEGVVIGNGNTNVMMQQHPIRWNPQGKAIDLGDLGYSSYLYTSAASLNSSGTVVGKSDDGWHMPNVPRYSIATEWDPAGNISALGGPVGGWNVAVAINDNGVVCGVSSNTDGSNMHAVVWHRSRASR